MIQKLRNDLNKYASKERAKSSERFFKTGKGEYGEGDKFIGISVPEGRKIAKKYIDLSFKDQGSLLESKIHEERGIATEIMCMQYTRAKKNEDTKDMKKIVDFYIRNRKGINNWDLVDGTAPYILGDWLIDRDKSILYRYAKSNNLWEKRIAIISTYAFIKSGEYKDTLKISEILLNDEHDLIHKAVGWMLREVGNRDLAVEEKFLKKNYKKMPRTMLRYAIEKFPKAKYRRYLKGLV